MKLKSKSSKKKFTIVALIVATVIVLGAAGYALYRANPTQPSTNDATGFQDANPIDTQSQKKQQSYEEQKKEESTENKPEETDTLTTTFTSVSQMNTTVRVRSEINALIDRGTCTLTFTKGNDAVTKTAVTQPLAGISTCQGFDIATSELSPGTWNVTLEVTKDGRAGRATTTIDIS